MLPKLLISLLILTATVKSSSAQEQPFRFGMKFSGNLSWIKSSSNNIERNGVGFGYSYGLMGDFNFQENYALSTELLISQFAGSITHIDSLVYEGKGYNNVGYEYNFQYLQIPVSLKLRTKEIGYMTYWVQFGLSPGVLLGARADVTGGPEEWGERANNIRVNDKSNDEFQFADFDDKVFFMRLPLIIGAGIEYSLAGNASLYLGFRVNNGFTNVFVADEATSARNNLVSLSTGVFF